MTVSNPHSSPRGIAATRFSIELFLDFKKLHAYTPNRLKQVLINCDADTGFGNAVIRMVCDFENAGIAGIQLEDQILPKKCGHTEGKLLVSKGEMVQKIKVAVDTRKDNDFILVIRTDAIAVNGIDDALDRAAPMKRLARTLFSWKRHKTSSR